MRNIWPWLNANVQQTEFAKFLVNNKKDNDSVKKKIKKKKKTAKNEAQNICMTLADKVTEMMQNIHKLNMVLTHKRDPDELSQRSYIKTRTK